MFDKRVFDLEWLVAATTALKVLAANSKGIPVSLLTSYETILEKSIIWEEDKNFKEIYLKKALVIQWYVSSQRYLLVRDGKIFKLGHLVVKSIKRQLEKNKDLIKLWDPFNTLDLLDLKEASNTLSEILFGTGAVVLVEEIEYFELKKEQKKKRAMSNYIPIIKKLAQNYLYQILYFIREENIQVDKVKLDAYYKIFKTEIELIEIGKQILDLFEDLGYIKEVSTISNDKISKNIILSEKGISTFKQAAKIDNYPYSRLPMLHNPYPISQLFGTGYFPCEVGFERAVKLKYTGCQVIDSTPSMDKALNYLSNIPYRLNFFLYQLYLTKIVKAEKQFNLPDYIAKLFDVLISPIGEKNEHVIRVKYEMTRFTYLFSIISLVICQSQNRDINEFIQQDKIALFSLIEEEGRVYSPVTIDTRTRINSSSQIWLSGSEFERSFFSPAITQKVSYMGAKAIINYFLCLYGKTREGNAIKSMSWNNKIKYFFDNLAFFKDSKNIETAKKPFLYTAIYSKLDKLKFWDTPTLAYLAEQETDIGIYVDNTSSGSQILSTLIGDLSSNDLLNLEEQSFDEEVGDLYQHISNLCNSILFEDFKITSYKLDSYLKLTVNTLNINTFFTRSLVKEPIMAAIYGISKKKVKELIIEAILEKPTLKQLAYEQKTIDHIYNAFYKYQKKNGFLKNKFQFKKAFKKYILGLPEDQQKLYSEQTQLKANLYKISDKLATLLMSSIKHVLPDMFILYNLMTAYADSLAQQNESITWKTLTQDATIEQAYQTVITKRIPLPKRFGRKRRYLSIKSIDNKNADVRKNTISFMANFTHSIDATILRHVVNKLQDKYPTKRKLYGTIHDSFLITPYDYEEFMEIYKEAFINVFSETNLELFLASLKGSPTHLKTVTNPTTFCQVEDYFNQIKSLIKVTEKNRAILLKKIKHSKYILYF